jgi:DnaJ-class molecular chaperone
MSLLSSFKLLGLDLDARVAAIKDAYKNHAMAKHPDVGGDVQDFTDLNEAYKQCVEYARRVPCGQCGGHGFTDRVGADLRITRTKCDACQGTGRREYV